MGKVRRDWFEIFAASECQASAKAAVSHTVTVSTPFKGWNFKPSEGANIEGTGYLVRAKDGVLIRASEDRRVWEKQIVDFEFLEGIEWTPQQIAAITDPGHTHDIAAPVGLAGPKASVEYHALMVKEPWIEVEVSVTPEMRNAGWQAWAARDDAGDETMDTIYRAMRPLEPTQEVPFVKGGHYDPDDSERWGCHLIWWPDELQIPSFSGEPGSRTLRLHCPTSGMPTYYDVSYDERRPITQEILDNMERCINKLVGERDGWQREHQALGSRLDGVIGRLETENASLRTELMAAPVELIGDGERIWHTRALIAEGRVAELEGMKDERDEARSDADHWSKECTRAVGLFEERGRALLHILGDMPSPSEDPYERCRKIASNALGYQDPEPMLLAGREDLLNAVAYWAGEYANRNQACGRQAVVLGDAANEIAMLRTELMAARDTIARFTAANVPDPPKADPIANAIREFPRDMRRMGP